MNRYILTFDYELFGSGRGDVFKHLINPTKYILLILDQLNIKATFFIEQLEIDALIGLKYHYDTSTQEYKNAVSIEEQLKEIALQGHDMQLHIHPQWHNAIYENKTWKLNFDWWRFSKLPYHTSGDGIPGKYELIRDGKKSLENRIRKTNPHYQCHSFRAGGYNIGDDKSSIDALINNGMKLDSSICPGFFSNSMLSQYDYTTVDSSLNFWRSHESLLVSSTEVNKSCLQLPLITLNSSFNEKLSCARIFATIKNRRYKRIDYADGLTADSPLNHALLTNSNFDVCLSSRAQIRKFNRRIQIINESRNMFTPITLIGHPKDISVFSPIKKILKELVKINRFITVTDFIREVN